MGNNPFKLPAAHPFHGFHTRPLRRPQVETHGQQSNKPLVLSAASCVFGYPENHLAFALRHPDGQPRAKGEKPAQLGFSFKRGPKTTNKPMDKPRKKAGRPPMLSGKRNRLIKAKLTDEEFSELIRIQKASGMNRMELIRKRVLGSGTAVTVNMKEVLGELDTIGAELGRAGNNINQLARHANILNRQQRLDPGVVAEFNALFTEYIRIQRELEKTLRQLLRTMK